MVNKRVRNAVLGCSLKNDRMISVCFQGKPFNITVIQVYTQTTIAKKAEVEWFYEDWQDLLELTLQKDVLFITGDWNAKVGSQEIPGINLALEYRMNRAKANRVLPRECTGHSKYPLPTTQEKTLYIDITRWSTPKSDWLSSIQSAKTRQGADCGSDHELHIAEFMLKLKKVGKNTVYSRSEKQIQGIRFDRQSAWRTTDGGYGHCIGGSGQDHPQEKEMQKGKMLVWGGLTNTLKTREAESKGEKEKYTHLNAEF